MRNREDRHATHMRTVDIFFCYLYYVHTRRGVEQLAARRAHNPEAAGSSPAPAITETLARDCERFLILNQIGNNSTQDSKRSERPENCENLEQFLGKLPGMAT